MLEEVPAKTIVNRTKDTSWFGTDYNMNIYRGCCHGCIYCDSRSACYGIEDFERVRVKKDALRIIRDDLRRKVRTGVVGTGSMSDPYNPHEKKLELTRHALELLNAFSFGVAIATKGALITRDMDVLQEIQTHSPVICKVTVTTVDQALAAKVEPGAPSPVQRLSAVEQLAKEGIFTGILLMPVLPFLEDSVESVLAVVDRAANSGARFVYPAFGMTMRENQREWYLDKLEALFPGKGLSEHYRKRYGNRYTCASPRAKALWAAFAARCDEKGLLYHMKDIVSAYKSGYNSQQLTFR